MTDADTLWIVIDTDAETVEETIEVKGARKSIDIGGGFDSTQVLEAVKTRANRQRVPLDAQALKSQMQGMLAVVNELFDQAQTTSGLQLNEVELSVEINAEGQVSLVGNGGKLGNSGGITLKFVRPQ